MLVMGLFREIWICCFLCLDFEYVVYWKLILFLERFLMFVGCYVVMFDGNIVTISTTKQTI